MSFRELLDKSGGRKLVSSGILFLASTVLLCVGVGGVDFQMWANFNLILLGVYVGGNVGAKLSNRKIKEQVNE